MHALILLYFIIIIIIIITDPNGIFILFVNLRFYQFNFNFIEYNAERHTHVFNFLNIHFIADLILMMSHDMISHILNYFIVKF